MTQITPPSPETTSIVLPIPPSQDLYSDDIAVYAQFMRYLRHVPHRRMEIRILSSIQFTADMLDYSDAQVAKILVDLGLRAPRLAFPADFLKFADRVTLRPAWHTGAITPSVTALRQHWLQNGEDSLAVFHQDLDYPVERVGV